LIIHGARATLIAVGARSKLRLNQPKNRLFLAMVLGFFNIVAQSAGVRISATSTDSTMADTMVTANCR
jgi:hypothetical protein